MDFFQSAFTAAAQNLGSTAGWLVFAVFAATGLYRFSQKRDWKELARGMAMGLLCGYIAMSLINHFPG